ncbi:hypothetical protein OV320_7836 [Actinobacteria bacterium OV320]|nr:hypothetical protein OV320_7836 [Actinobacteria bacterium OV320]
MSSVAAAFDREGRTVVAFTGSEGWTDVYLIDFKGEDMTKMWSQQADAITSLRKFEENCHPTMRPFKYVGK